MQLKNLQSSDYYNGDEAYSENHYLVTYVLHHSFKLKPISEFYPFPQISFVHKYVIDAITHAFPNPEHVKNMLYIYKSKIFSQDKESRTEDVCFSKTKIF